MKKLLLLGLFAFVAPVSADTGVTLYSNTTSYLQMRAPDGMTSNYRMLMPLAKGTTNQVLGITGVAGSTVTMGFVTGSGGGGGSSSLAVNQNGINITSPTAALNLLAPPFIVTAVSGGSTAQFTLNPTSVTLQGNTYTFTSIASSMTALGVSTTSLQTQLTAVGVATGTLKTRVDNLDASTATLTARLNNLDSSTATLTTRLNNLDSSTATITTRLNNLDSSTATITTRLIAVGVSTASLQTQVNAVGVATGTLALNFPVSLSTGVTSSLPDSRLSSNVALLNATQTFSGAQSFTSPTGSSTTYGVYASSLTVGTKGGFGGSVTMKNSGNQNGQLIFQTDAGAGMGNISLLNGGFFRLVNDLNGPTVLQTNDTDRLRINYTGSVDTLSSATVQGAGGFGVTYGAIFGSATVSDLPSGQCVQTTTGGRLTTTGSGCSAGGGGSSSSLAIYTGTATNPITQISSPTAIVNVDQGTMASALTGSATAYITVQAGISSVSGNFTVGSTSTVVYADAAGGSLTVTLPTAVGISGRLFTVKRLNSGSNTVTVGTTSAQTIDGATTQILTTQYTSVGFRSNNANWMIE